MKLAYDAVSKYRITDNDADGRYYALATARWSGREMVIIGHLAQSSGVAIDAASACAATRNGMGDNQHHVSLCLRSACRISYAAPLIHRIETSEALAVHK